LLKCRLSSDLRREGAGSFCKQRGWAFAMSDTATNDENTNHKDPYWIFYVEHLWTWSVKGLQKRTFRPQLQGCRLLAYGSMIVLSHASALRFTAQLQMDILSFALSSAISTKYSPFDDADHLIEYEQSHVQPSGIVYIQPSIYLWLQAVVSAIEL
jgi:hypothetical protein